MMTEHGRCPRAARWLEALGRFGSRKLEAMAFNYIGAAAARWDRDRIIRAIAAFMEKEETREAAIGMLDRRDVLILGTISLMESAAPAFLRDLFAGEMPPSEIDRRLASLGERLIVFENESGGIELVPAFADELKAGIIRAGMLFGPSAAGSGEGQAEAAGAEPLSGTPVGGAISPVGKPARVSLQDVGLAAFGFLRENDAPFLKSGVLSMKAKAGIQALCGTVEGFPDMLERAIGVFAGGAALRPGEAGGRIDSRLVQKILAGTGMDFPFWLALGLCGGHERQAGKFAAWMRDFVGKDFRFSREGFRRIVMIAAARSGIAAPAEDIFRAMRDFGMVREDGGLIVCDSGSLARRPRAGSGSPGEGGGIPGGVPRKSVSVDGTGSMHIFPTAPAEDVIFLLSIGELRTVSGAWTAEISKDSIRKAFAEGYSADGIASKLELMSGMPLPQSLAFNIATWQEEFDAVRLFKGYVLAVNPSVAPIVEKAGKFNRLGMMKIGEGVYFLGSSHRQDIEKAFIDSGLPAPQIIGRAGFPAAGSGGEREAASSEDVRYSFEEKSDSILPEGFFMPESGAGRGETGLFAADSARADYGAADFGKELSDVIGTLHPGAAERRDLEERVERKLIYSPRQLRDISEAFSAGRAAGRPARGRSRPVPGPEIEAGGLDFRGKLHIIQDAIKSRFSRLEIRWIESGEIAASVIRPESLARTGDDYFLEGEDAAKGEPVRIRVGSIRQVRLLRGYFFGEDK